MDGTRVDLAQAANKMGLDLASGILPNAPEQDAATTSCREPNNTTAPATETTTNNTTAPATETTTTPRSKASVSVYARVRPLVGDEVKECGEVSIEIDALDENKSTQIPNGVTMGCGQRINGFTGVFNQSHCNEDVFQHALQPKLATVLKGGCASFFCYGYTGGGKTHTVVGYGEESGVFSQAASDLLDLVRETYGDEYFLSVTACEVYCNKVFDLLDDRHECCLKVDETGQLYVMASPVRVDVTADSDAHPSLVEAVLSERLAGRQELGTIVTKQAGLKQVQVRKREDIDSVRGVLETTRSVGESTTHDQSSRSHVILTVEVVTDEVLKRRQALASAESYIPVIKNVADNLGKQYWSQLTEQGSLDTTTMSLLLKEYADPGEWERRKSALDELRPPIIAAYEICAKAVQEKRESLTEALDASCVGVGGKLVVVDLAGADYDGRDIGRGTHAQEKRESAEINKSLLSLKKCLRAIAGVPGESKRPPFRDSKLTRLLEDSLNPNAYSQRRNCRSESVMILAVSPNPSIERMTINALRYGQLFSVKAGATTLASVGTKTRNKDQVKPWHKNKTKESTSLAPDCDVQVF